MGIKITELTLEHIKQWNPRLFKEIQETAPLKSNEVTQAVVDAVTTAARREAVRQQKFF